METSRFRFPVAVGWLRDLAFQPMPNEPWPCIRWDDGLLVGQVRFLDVQAEYGMTYNAVYGVTGMARRALADWFSRCEEAYFGRSSFQVGDGPLSLELLIWEENPAAPGPEVYWRDRLPPGARAGYARELKYMRGVLAGIQIPNQIAKTRTLACVEGTLQELDAIAKAQP